MQEVWHWLAAIYLFLGGLGAGAFLIAAIVELTGDRDRQAFCPITLVGSTISGPAVGIGAVLLVIELGAGLREPWRIPYMFTHFSSVMTWGIWILTLFIPIAMLYGFFEVMDTYPDAWAWIMTKLRFKFLKKIPVRRVKRMLAAMGSVFAVSTGIYTGVLLCAVGPAIPLWSAPLWPGLSIPLLPALFLVSAVSTGMGLTIDMTATISEPETPHRFRFLPVIHMSAIGIEAILVGLLLFSAKSLGGAASQSVDMIVSGHMRVAFWVGFVFVGLVYPFSVHAYAIGAGRHSALSGIGSGIGIVFAGLFLRYIILSSGITFVL
ncbi:MAG: NrfD/PsrC family molybdoenzyme membrane anchor subunit [Chloroflexota bacterium]